MTKFAFALLMTAFVSTGVMAQVVPGAVGVVQSTEGLVTVSQGNTLGNAFINERILDGARVVTTGTGTTVIRLINNGCLIRLDPNQSVTIDSRLGCTAQVASIQSTGAQAGAGSAAGGGGNASGLVFLGVGALGAYYNQRGSGS